MPTVEVVSIVFQLVFNLKCKNHKYNIIIKYLLVAHSASTSIEYSIINRVFDDEMKSILSEKSIVRYNRNNKFGNHLNYLHVFLKNIKIILENIIFKIC